MDVPLCFLGSASEPRPTRTDFMRVAKTEIYQNLYFSAASSIGTELSVSLISWPSAGAVAISLLTIFEFVLIPVFPDDVETSIVHLYHNAALPPKQQCTLANFVEWHREWNKELGILELDREMKKLQTTLTHVQEQIIDGRIVELVLQ